MCFLCMHLWIACTCGLLGSVCLQAFATCHMNAKGTVPSGTACLCSFRHSEPLNVTYSCHYGTADHQVWSVQCLVEVVLLVSRSSVLSAPSPVESSTSTARPRVGCPRYEV